MLVPAQVLVSNGRYEAPETVHCDDLRHIGGPRLIETRDGTYYEMLYVHDPSHRRVVLQYDYITGSIRQSWTFEDRLN